MNKKTIFRLSAAFGLVYFFSTNGMASLPGIAVNFLLKETLQMTASQAAYFGAVTMLGWAIKPLWGVISDAVPIFGYRRKPYLMLTSLVAAGIWFWLGQIEIYTVSILIALFTVSSFIYAFNDVVTDGLMVQTGKPYGITDKFQSVQWTAVYAASIITGLAGGWAAENLKSQTIFSVNAVFPILVVVAIFLLITEEKSQDHRKQLRESLSALKETVKNKTIWLIAFFLFFWTFSPSFGMPFFYYSVDVLKFDKFFLGIASAVGSASSMLGAILYGKYAGKFKIKKLINFAILFGVTATLFSLIYFIPLIARNLWLANATYISSNAILGAVGSFVTLAMLNMAAVICPKNSEGTTFAALTSFWNIGAMSSAALGGWLFDQIGLQPLIIVSAVFTALTWLIVPYLKLE
ncbi:MFS transporter [Candidatus Giovannonibacteria bacterium]|nr:MFS transporter [Candidatus Giovannonibacteria bacterium]